MQKRTIESLHSFLQNNIKEHSTKAYRTHEMHSTFDMADRLYSTRRVSVSDETRKTSLSECKATGNFLSEQEG